MKFLNFKSIYNFKLARKYTLTGEYSTRTKNYSEFFTINKVYTYMKYSMPQCVNSTLSINYKLKLTNNLRVKVCEFLLNKYKVLDTSVDKKKEY